jgi:hypothetical protein
MVDMERGAPIFWLSEYSRAARSATKRLDEKVRADRMEEEI